VSNTVYGILADELGLASATTLVQGVDRPQLRTRAWATPSAEIRDVQAARIPVDRDHDHRWVGEVVSLQRIKGNLWCIAHVDEDVTPTVNVKVGADTVSARTNLYWSASRLSTPDYEDVIIDSVALTRSPCRVGARPVTFLPGALDHRAAADRWRDQLDWFQRDLLTRAAHDRYERRVRGRDTPIVVHDAGLDHGDLDRLSANERHVALTLAADLVVDRAWQHQPLRWRPGRVLDVR
jgi:hypothetical protein